MMSDTITWLCACVRMRKSAKNDNNIRESDRQELTSLYRYVPRETEKIGNAASKKKITYYHVPVNVGKDFYIIGIWKLLFILSTHIFLVYPTITWITEEWKRTAQTVIKEYLLTICTNTQRWSYTIFSMLWYYYFSPILYEGLL